VAPASGGSGWRPPAWWKGGRSSFLAAAAVLVVVALAVALMVWRPWTGRGGESAFTFREGKYVDTSVPWHISISAGPEAPSGGCAVKVRDQTKSGTVMASTQHASSQDNVILQVSNSGSFYLDYQTGCLINAERVAVTRTTP